MEDWKIDIEREATGENKNKAASVDPEKKEPYLIEFERLSEFYFDLCLSWCQHLELEVFLYFVNGIFLNITKGAHVKRLKFSQSSSSTSSFNTGVVLSRCLLESPINSGTLETLEGKTRSLGMSRMVSRKRSGTSRPLVQITVLQLKVRQGSLIYGWTCHLLTRPYKEAIFSRISRN